MEPRPGITARKFPAKGKSIEARCGRHAERGTCTYPVAVYGLNGSDVGRIVRAAGGAKDHERITFSSSARIRTAPQVPHVNTTLGLGSSSSGGALGTTSMSGAETTLRVLGKRVGIAASSSEFGTRHKFVPAVTQFKSSERLLACPQPAPGALQSVAWLRSRRFPQDGHLRPRSASIQLRHDPEFEASWTKLGEWSLSPEPR